jgi:hypothetical protein
MHRGTTLKRTLQETFIMNEIAIDNLYVGLQALAESAFPKRCNNCGRRFENSEEFIKATNKLRPDVSGLKQTINNDGSAIVELFRNCACGSTLMDAFNNRRDLSEKGERRRQRFQELQDYLTEKHHLEPSVARDELLKLMKGEKTT